MFSNISIHLKDGPSMCPFGTLNQGMFAYIHHKLLSTKAQYQLNDLFLVSRIYNKMSMVAHHHANVNMERFHNGL
jgi:hypothetical protein